MNDNKPKDAIYKGGDKAIARSELSKALDGNNEFAPEGSVTVASVFNTKPVDDNTFTPSEDVYEDRKNGKGRVLVAPAGVAMPKARAKALGLL